MNSIYVKKILEVQKNKELIEKELKVKIKIVGHKVSVEGEPVEEYIAESVFCAINFGFPIRKSLMLKSEETVFKIIHIKSYTKRNLKDVLARLIGKRGKTRKTFSEISGCEIIVKDTEVGILGEVEAVGNAETAIISLIRGSKQANMYRYLERMNREKRLREFEI